MKPYGTMPSAAGHPLQNVIGESVTLHPDDSGKFMWAEYGIETAALLQAAGGGKSAIVVAGARCQRYLALVTALDIAPVACKGNATFA